MSATSGKLEDLGFSKSQKKALLTLLADDDQEVFEQIRETIVDRGAAAAEWLQDYTLDSDPILRKRVRGIVAHFELQIADTNFLRFCLSKGEKFDVEEGAWLLAKTRYSDINVAAYSAVLDEYAEKLKDRIDFGAPPGQILRTISYYLYHDMGYVGNVTNYYDPENSYLNRVVDNKTGNPISLSAIYLFVAQRLHLPLVGIGMPGHFICRFQSSKEEIYIDPFQQGKMMTKGQCIKMLIQSGHDYHESFIAPISPRRMLLRICSNLQHAYTTQDQPAEGTRLQRYIIALSK
jgi:regulator of sirC expression with transglutaminase-like and TPR domain